MENISKNRKADEDIFEICDFTVVTDFEHLVLALETALIEWKLNGNSISSPPTDFSTQYQKDFLRTCTWNVEVQTVKHVDKSFKLLYYRSTPKSSLEMAEPEEPSHQTRSALSLSSQASDFVPSVISTQFGVFDFVLVVDSDSDVAQSEDDVLMMVSAFANATVNTECEVPIFLQIGPARNRLYSGISQNRHVRTNFEGSFLRKHLYNHDNLSGLIGILREKVATPLPRPPQILASIQFDYCLQERLDNIFTSGFPDANIDMKSLYCSSSTMLPFGATADPLREFRLAVRWPYQLESVLNESLTFTVLEPDYAPFWFVNVELSPSVPCLLFDGLKTVVKLSSSDSGSYKVLDFIRDSGIGSMTGTHALSKLASDHSTSYKFVPSEIEKFEENQELAEKLTKKIFEQQKGAKREEVVLEPITPENTIASTKVPGSAVKKRVSVDGSGSSTIESENSDLQMIAQIISTSKNAPVGSFTERMCLCLARSLMTQDNGVVLFSHNWNQIVKELRKFWENSTNLPGFATGQVPDLSTCLLHQKLQMLQCCIEARRKSYELYDETTNFNSDVFFDALEDQPMTGNSSGIIERSPSEHSGRSRPVDGLMYLHDTTKQIFEPITQDRSPMTEDMIEEHAEYLSNLDDSEARVNAQLSSLTSDMQAFKAANPGCCISDFVRWHSPRDWITDGDDSVGHLSERMSTEGNTWQVTWNAAHAMPVSLQQRLFNYSGDAEKILQRFESMTVSELIRMVVPVLFNSAIGRLLDEV
ncbi:hypothetical protein L596_003366 [Steinernema carpocapsae]|uniref:Rab3 GTPase-activating protein catalytic subunit n=1 Tax=Steinernema carpocapsae TaxID=34508 RepID=A0A4U8UVA5_STECR|nr:hypothetical protein L596_003366 [Steinernema carpocapsae]